VACGNLGQARSSKNDEFHTQYADIEKEMNAYLEFNPDVFKKKTVLLQCDDPEWSNFTKYFAQRFQDLGLKKLIGTAYASSSKPNDSPYQPTLFEMDSPEFDEEKTYENGKIFTLTRDTRDDWDALDDSVAWWFHSRHQRMVSGQRLLRGSDRAITMVNPSAPPAIVNSVLRTP